MAAVAILIAPFSVIELFVENTCERVVSMTETGGTAYLTSSAVCVHKAISTVVARGTIQGITRCSEGLTVFVGFALNTRTGQRITDIGAAKASDALIMTCAAFTIAKVIIVNTRIMNTETIGIAAVLTI